MDVLYSRGSILKFCKNFLIDYSIMMRFWTHFIIFTGPAISNPSLQKIVLYLSTSDVMYFVMEKRKTLAKMPFWLFQVENCYFVIRYLLILKKIYNADIWFWSYMFEKLKKLKYTVFVISKLKIQIYVYQHFCMFFFYIYYILYYIIIIIFFVCSWDICY